MLARPERLERVGQSGAVGQPQLRVELEQRDEHEPPAAHLAVREGEPVGAQLDVCKAVEVEHGRVFGGPRHGPRSIDIDLLLLGDIEMSSDRLTLPHREVSTRRFVLVPLLELDPELRLPDGSALADALEQIAGQEVRLVGPLTQD